MLKITDKLYELKYKSERDSESGAAMIFAVILLMLMLFISVFIATTATTQAGNARQQQLRESAIAAANNGIEWMLQEANKSTDSLETYRGIGKAYTSPTTSTEKYSVNGTRWRVFTEQVVTSGGALSYYIYSTGFNEKTGVDEGTTLRATFESYDVDSAAYTSGGTPVYYLNAQNTWGSGVLGEDKAAISSGAKLYSYESGRNGFVPSGTDTFASGISTNGAVTLGDNQSGLKSIVSSVPTANTGCKPGTPACDGVTTTYRGSELSLNRVDQIVNQKCTKSSYPIWVASENNGLLDLTTDRCLGGMVFDRSTTMSGAITANAPLQLFVKGPVTVNSGVKVNYNGSPLELQVFSTGGNLTLNSSPQTNLLYASAGATCTITGSSVFLGSTSCAQVNISGTSKYYYDISARTAVEVNTTTKVWLKIFVEQVNLK